MVHEDGTPDEAAGARLPIAKNLAAANSPFGWDHVESRINAELLAAIDKHQIPDIVRGALIATETRPRCDLIDRGALINLRGAAETSEQQADQLVSIRMWVERGHVFSVSRYPLAATKTVRRAWEAGELADPGDLVAAYAKAISIDLDPAVSLMSDEVDDCESGLETNNIYELRRKIAAIRSEAIAYRRFVAPNRDALLRLVEISFDWLADDDRLHIREAADRFARMTEELENIRERSALLHEQLTDMRAELIDRRSLMIAVVAFIFLPLTFITGLLGMNVEGIPFAHSPWSFWGVVIFCLLVGIVVLFWFFVRRWLGR